MRKSFKQLISLLLVFMCVIGMVPGTYAVPVSVTSDEVCEQTDSTDNLHFIDANDVVANDSVTGFEDYILEHMNRDYVGEGDELIPYDIISVKQTIVDKDAMLANSQPLTIDGLWIDNDNDAISDYPEVLLNQIESTALLYQISPDADYVVGHVDSLRNAAADVVDWIFAETSLSGSVLDDCIYDFETGLVYIPQYYLYVSGDGLTMNQTQIQLLYAYSGDVATATTQVQVEVDATRINGSVPTIGVMDVSLWDEYLSIQIAGDDKALRSLTSDSIEAVYVDGAKVSPELDVYLYDEEIGVLYIADHPASIDTVRVVLRNPSGLETAANAILNLFVTKANAATHAGTTATAEQTAAGYTQNGNYNKVYGNTIYEVASITDVWQVDKIPVASTDITIFANNNNPDAVTVYDYMNSGISVDYRTTNKTQHTTGTHLSFHNADTIVVAYTAYYIIGNGLGPNSSSSGIHVGTVPSAKYIHDGLTSIHGADWVWTANIPAGTYNLDGTNVTIPSFSESVHCAHVGITRDFVWQSNSFTRPDKGGISYKQEQEVIGLRICQVVTYADGKSGRMLIGITIPTGGHGQGGASFFVVDWEIGGKTASIKATKAVRGGSGANLGWQFGLYNSNKNLITSQWTPTTGSDYSVTFDGLEAGTYYVREIGGPKNGNGAFYTLDTTWHKVVITQAEADAQKVKAVTITNEYINPIKIKVKKTTPTGEGVDWRWHFGLYSAKNTGSSYLLDDGWTKASTSDPTYTFDVDLAPGTYYIKELDDSLTTYNTDKKKNVDLNTDWITVSVTKSEAGKTVTVTHQNSFRYGRGSFKKVAKNGSTADLDGWVFTVYSNATCTNVIATGVTDTSGNVKVYGAGRVSNLMLAPGTYYVKETGHVDYAKYAANGTMASTGLFKTDGSGYIYNDPAVTGGNKATIVIEAGKTTDLTITNTWGGRIKVQKTTNTGNNKAGWQFTVYTDSACTKIAKDIHGNNVVLTTGNDGTATSNLLPKGTYYVKETGGTLYGNAAWKCDVDRETASVTIGSTTTVNFSNDHYGKLSLIKDTNTGANKDNWVFTVYTDANCTQIAKYKNGNNATLTTGTDGRATSDYLLPGTYYVKETGGTRYNDPYWVVSTEVKTVTVVAGNVTAVSGGSYMNYHHGRITIQKEMATTGPLNGWNFIVYTDEACTTVALDKTGAQVTMTTDANGQCISGYLLPGTYFIKEIIDEEGGLYYCKTRNPLPVTVVAGVDTRAQSGEEQDVSFINALRPIEIEILKVDPNGSPLANVTFMLEWSSDGTNWKVIQYSDAEDVVAGYTSSSVNANGELMTGADGLVVFENLHPEYQYRITETATTNGMVLLRDSVVVTPDDVPMDQAETTAPFTRHYEMTVVNQYGWEMTPTGESSLPMTLFVGGGMFLALVGIAMFVMYELNRKKKVVRCKVRK